MAFANNQGIRVHYEVIGQGFPLVLHHGLFGSWMDWVDFGYVDAFKRDYQLILPDGRGHGQSDKPYNPASYDRRLRALDVVAVLDDLGIAQAHYFGYSMGGYIGLGMAQFALKRIRSFVIGGTHPYAEDMTAFRQFINRKALATQIPAAFGAAATPELRSRLLANDLAAIVAATASDRASVADEVLPPLRTLPCLLYVGDLDPRRATVQQFAAQLPNATFFIAPGCDHVPGLTRSELVIIPHVTEFLRSQDRHPLGSPGENTDAR